MRGFDAIHLSSAIQVATSIQEELIFACSDNRLLAAAQLEGLSVMDVTIDSETKQK